MRSKTCSNMSPMSLFQRNFQDPLRGNLRWREGRSPQIETACAKMPALSNNLAETGSHHCLCAGTFAIVEPRFEVCPDFRRHHLSYCCYLILVRCEEVTTTQFGFSPIRG